MRNAIGRVVPDRIGDLVLAPFKGALELINDPRIFPGPQNSLQHGRSKVLPSLEVALKAVELRSGMTISFHHAYRNGDRLVNTVVGTCQRMGIGDLHLMPSALFPVHQLLEKHIDGGTISRIDGSINGSLGNYLSTGGKLKSPIVLRSHGGRWRAVESGDATIDVAFVAASQADAFGNATGIAGMSPCGPIGYAKIDTMRARRTIVVTNKLVPYPAIPVEIQQGWVDYVVAAFDVGDASGIASGSLIARSTPMRDQIGLLAAKTVSAAGLLKEGFSFQGGAGGLSLGAVQALGHQVTKAGIVAGFAIGGVTETLVKLLREGAVRTIMDCQAFDTVAIDSILADPGHIVIDPGFYANVASCGCATDMLDVAFLGATEVDLDFNANVITHSDGRLMHGIGGHQDVAAGASLTIIVIPSSRKGYPTILDHVTTVTTPGEVIDCVVTELGVAINPRRQDLRDRLKDSRLPMLSIEEMQRLADRGSRRWGLPEFTDEVIALVEWRDGTIIDTVHALA